ncbi:MAG: hypothetical protein ACREDC_07655 [Bradyrhizobium sp.]
MATGSLDRRTTALMIRRLAEQHGISYVPTCSDVLANQITRLSSDSVELDDIEHLLIALQRKNIITRDQLIHLQAHYLREARS